METIGRYTLIFYFSGFILQLTIIQKIYSTIKKISKRKIEIHSDQIDEIFKNLEILNLFYDFVKNEFSLENLLYQDIKKYEKLKEENERNVYGIEIFEWRTF